MSKELIEQLRDLANCRHDDLSIGYEAADRIEQLETERDQLREQVKKLQQLIYGLKPECDLAMKNTIAARIPECGDFGAIAQSLSYVIQEALAATELK